MRWGWALLLVATAACSGGTAAGSAAPVLMVPGIGRLVLTCGAHPKARMVLTHFAAGEGPQRVWHRTARTSGIGALTGVTDHGFTAVEAAGRALIPPPEQRHQQLEHWEVDGGGEAFGFAVTATLVISPGPSGCDALATAPTSLRGGNAFYRAAHARPAGARG